MQNVLADALALPTKERAELIGQLLESLDVPADETLDTDAWETSWIEELNRRIAELQAGQAHLVPAEAVFASLRERLAGTTR
ncbi:MAG TPA: addiction module protein [Haliangium sp.]|nr:addiction module protein [Haliangium sp.]